MKAFYKTTKHLHPKKKQNVIGKLTLKMFMKGRLKAKAAETRHSAPLLGQPFAYTIDLSAENKKRWKDNGMK